MFHSPSQPSAPTWAFTLKGGFARQRIETNLRKVTVQVVPVRGMVGNTWAQKDLESCVEVKDKGSLISSGLGTMKLLATTNKTPKALLVMPEYY